MKKYEKIMLFFPIIGYGFYIKHFQRKVTKLERNLLIGAQIYQLIFFLMLGRLIGSLI